jgi:hypothetical protein
MFWDPPHDRPRASDLAIAAAVAHLGGLRGTTAYARIDADGYAVMFEALPLNDDD